MEERPVDDSRSRELEARIADLEARLRRGDRRESVETAFWAMMHNVFPEETRRHMKAAGREQLMAARSYLDHWIAKLDEQGGAAAAERETIEVE
jgi:BMFP domain-containing protein YqiC